MTTKLKPEEDVQIPPALRAKLRSLLGVRVKHPTPSTVIPEMVYRTPTGQYCKWLYGTEFEDVFGFVYCDELGNVIKVQSTDARGRVNNQGVQEFTLSAKNLSLLESA